MSARTTKMKGQAKEVKGKGQSVRGDAGQKVKKITKKIVGKR